MILRRQKTMRKKVKLMIIPKKEKKLPNLLPKAMVIKPLEDQLQAQVLALPNHHLKVLMYLRGTNNWRQQQKRKPRSRSSKSHLC